MAYTFHIEDGAANFNELVPLYRAHFEETQARMATYGLRPRPFGPMMDRYHAAWQGGWLLNYVVRHDGEAVGAANVYITNDMHTGDIIAVEDTIYVTPAHRNGLGKKLVKFILADLPPRGVQRVMIDAVTDLRVAKVWRRMGFTDYAQRMVYHFQEDR